LTGNHDLPLYRISHPPLFYHKNGNSKIQAAYDAFLPHSRWKSCRRHWAWQAGHPFRVRVCLDGSALAAIWGARAPRLLAKAPRLCELFNVSASLFQPSRVTTFYN